MKLPEKLPVEFKDGIEALSLDASSIIYLLKVGLLGSVAAEIRLVASKGIMEEVDWPHLPIEVFPIENQALTNDQSVVALAVERGISVLSEDSEVLADAREHNLYYYNSLMILNYLLLKKRFSLVEYSVYLKRLKGIAHYSGDVLAYGASIKKLVENELRK